MLEAKAVLNALEETDGNQSAAARLLQVPRTTFRKAIKRIRTAGTIEKNGIDFPEIPEDDIPVDQIIDQMSQRFTRRQQAYRARQWMRYKVKEKKPIGIAWVGDPHVDSNGCNWPLLREHCRIMADTPGLYGASIGDHSDNWVGRLTRLYAESEQSRSTAIKLVDWLLRDSGVNWMLLLRGNHDMWTNEKRDDPIYWISHSLNVPLEDWAARITLDFPNGREARIHAAHNFKGHSMWNSLHGAQKQAHMKDQAHLYVCGHTHNWALHQEESASREFTYWLARARGYKFLDDFADVLGHSPQQGGATILSVFDSNAKSDSGLVQCFADLESGADYLTWARAKK
jgi:UDP-2,3-diacylglucosamine pyrophosphatase LpxH